MADEILRYDRLIQDAMLGVARRALRIVAEHGMPDDHHFYVGFRTAAPGVTLPPHLIARYPEEMTIVLQHQFYDLAVTDERFEVTLSFNRKMERLGIPFAALTAFTDPAANFRLQFPEPEEAEARPEPAAAGPSAGAGAADDDADGAPPNGAEVVSLDSFRKK